MAISPFSLFYVKSWTASDDDVHRFDDNPTVILESCNIHVYDNAANYGNTLDVPGVIQANSVVWFDSPIRPFDLCFKNVAAGANTRIVVLGPIREG